MRRVLYGLAVLLAVVQATCLATTLTASDVLTRARVYLRDQSTAANRQQFPDSTLLGFLSHGQREANAQNWLIETNIGITLPGTPSFIPMPDDFMASTRVWFIMTDGTKLKLTQTSKDKLDAQAPGWQKAVGLPEKYFLDYTNAFKVYMGFYPATLSTSSVIVEYIQQTADVSSLTDVPFNNNRVMQPYVTGLAYYVAYRGFLSVEETDLDDQYLRYWTLFLSLMRQGRNKTPDFNPG